MSGTFFLAASLFLGWILSPEALVINSNLAGQGGMLSPLLLASGGLFSFLGLLLAQYLNEERDATAGEEIILHGFGLAAAICLAIFIPTGILVTSGFTFNETFVYWFPNFGFSAILLALILAIHFLGDRTVETAQRIFSSIALAGLLIVILFGLLSPAQSVDELNTIATTPADYLYMFATSLLLYLGAYHMPLNKISPIRLFLIVAGGGVLLGLWQLTAIKFVAAEKLAATTIPYIFVAREAMGQPGRIIIGISIIFGTLAAVNYLFSFATRQTRQLMDSIVVSTKGAKLTGRCIALLLSIGIAFCMASGLAGEDHLETYIYASLLLWLLSAAAQVTIGWLRSGNIMFIMFPVAYVSTAVFMILTHEEVKPLVIFMALAICTSFIFTTAVVLLGKRTQQQLQ